MIDRTWRSVIFDEIIDSRQATSFMDRGVVHPAISGVKRMSFKNDKALLTLALNAASEFFLLLFPYLMQRAQIKGLPMSEYV